jgi:phage tail-like protein
MPNPAFESVDAPYTTFKFEVILNLDTPVAGISNPLCNAAFSECDGLEMTMDPKQVRSGGDNRRQVHLIQPVTYGRLTLKRGMTGNLQLWQWFTVAAAGGQNVRAQGQVIMHDADGTPRLEFILEDCLPVKIRGPQLNAATGLVAVEELQLVYAALSVRPAGQSGIGVSVGVGIGIGGSIGGSLSVSAGASVSGGAGLSVSGGPGLSGGVNASVSGGFGF